ncbi:MAG: radical SAM protein [Patescibacteria group bacterium]
MLKVLLVSLRSPFLDSDRVFPHLAILYLKGVLDKEGIQNQLEDDFDFDNPQKYAGFTHFAVSALSSQISEADKILAFKQKYFPNTKIILGGPAPTFYLEDYQKKPYDFFVIGDGEKAILKILYGQAERIVNCQMTAEEMNLMPTPFRSAEFLKKYVYNINGIHSTTLMTSRGCPFGCDFCENARTKVKLYTQEHINQEIIDVKRAGFGGIMFFDDLFAMNIKRVREVCSVIKKHNIIFRCFGHSNTMTVEIAETLADSGCVEIGVGFESGAQSILDVVKHPRTTISKNLNFIKICHKYKIRVKSFFVLGLPGEASSTINETEKFIAESGVDDFDLSIYYPYKGTRIRDKMEEYDLNFVRNGEGSAVGYYKGQHGHAESIVRTSSLSADEIVKARDMIFQKYKKTP